MKRILQIGNWPPPVCGWSMSLVGLRKKLESCGWDCQVMNLNENRKIRSSEYIDVQGARDYVSKITHFVRRGYAVHVRVNGDSKKGYVLALTALSLARVWRRPALLTYCGGAQQPYFPAPRGSLRHALFSLLFRIPVRIYCNSEAVKAAVLTTGIGSTRVAPIPHFSAQYIEFTPASIPAGIERFCRRHDGVFFVYACFRKEYMLEFLADVIRQFRAAFPRIGFLLVGTTARELPPLNEFLNRRQLDDSVYVTGSLAHPSFLTLMQRSLAYIRLPLMDGVSASVLEALALGTPVFASDNSARPPGVELFPVPGDAGHLIQLMTQALTNRDSLVTRIPQRTLEDNTARLADDIERVCLGAEYGRSMPISRMPSKRRVG